MGDSTPEEPTVDRVLPAEDLTIAQALGSVQASEIGVVASDRALGSRAKSDEEITEVAAQFGESGF